MTSRQLSFPWLTSKLFLNNKQFLRIWSNVLRTFVIPITIWCSVQFKWFYSRIINAEDIYVTEGWDFEWRIVIRVALSYVLSQWFPMSIWTKIMKMRRNEHFWPYLNGYYSMIFNRCYYKISLILASNLTKTWELCRFQLTFWVHSTQTLVKIWNKYVDWIIILK